MRIVLKHAKSSLGCKPLKLNIEPSVWCGVHLPFSAGYVWHTRRAGCSGEHFLLMCFVQHTTATAKRNPHCGLRIPCITE